jgi:hypothetical protein
MHFSLPNIICTEQLIEAIFSLIQNTVQVQKYSYFTKLVLGWYPFLNLFMGIHVPNTSVMPLIWDNHMKHFMLPKLWESWWKADSVSIEEWLTMIGVTIITWQT